MDKLTVVLIFGLLLYSTQSTWVKADPSLSILNYGAATGGKIDNSRAFLKAWKAACETTGNPTVDIPQGMQFLVNPVVFKGPCKASITFQVRGEIIAPRSPGAWKGRDQGKWITFLDVTSGLAVTGNGTINGRGKRWWDQSCRDHHGLKGCTSLAPTALNFISSNSVTIGDLHFLDAPQVHILLMGCNSVNVNNLEIVAPGLSPNTDGIHIQAVHGLNITNSRIGTGDDCISIGDYTSDVKITNIECGPGHGISIGSLGKDGNEVKVENIHVSNVTFTGTTNGARIKTWQVGTGNVRGVTFEDIKFNSVENPIIIDQNYCEIRGACAEKTTGVHISDVSFKNMVGTSSTEAAITLNCSRAVPCTGLLLNSIQLTSNITGKGVTAGCSNAGGTAAADVQPALGRCLQN